MSINGADIMWEGEGMYYRDLVPIGNDRYAEMYKKCGDDFRGWYDPPVRIVGDDLVEYRTVWVKERGKWCAYSGKDWFNIAP